MNLCGNAAEALAGAPGSNTVAICRSVAEDGGMTRPIPGLCVKRADIVASVRTVPDHQAD